MEDDDKAQETPTEGVQEEEVDEENQEINAADNPAMDSVEAEAAKSHEATNAVEADIPPTDQPLGEEGTAAPDAEGSPKEEDDKQKDEEVNGTETSAPEKQVTEEGEETDEKDGEPELRADTEERKAKTEGGEEGKEPTENEDGTTEAADQGDGPSAKCDVVTTEGVEETPEEDRGGVGRQAANGDEENPKSPLPQSDTFQDGERPETPTVQVPEPLSREASPKEEPHHLHTDFPEIEESPRPEDINIEEEEEPLFNREELLEALQAAVIEREQLHNHNTQLQHKLAEYFRKKKSDDQRQELDKNVTDQEQRYLKYMSNLEELRNQEEDERDSFHLHLEELKEKKQEKLELVDEEDKSFTELKRAVASDAISSRTGKPLMPREVEMYITNELKKEEEVKMVRLENIKLKNRLKKREQQLKAKEELAEGLHLIDFEQLKIENQTYNEKIEERNEELLKLRKKITSTVQVLTHVKEKLQFVQAENHVQKASLREVEAYVAQKRDLLSRTKKARDSLRIDNQRLRQKCGLLGNTALLRDFEERKDEREELRTKLDRLKRQHAELILKSAGVKRKIEETRS